MEGYPVLLLITDALSKMSLIRVRCYAAQFSIMSDSTYLIAAITYLFTPKNECAYESLFLVIRVSKPIAPKLCFLIVIKYVLH